MNKNVEGPMTQGVMTYGIHNQIINKTARQGTHGFPTVDYDVERIINSHTSLPYGRETLIYKFITDLKSDLGINEMSEMFDCFYMFASATQSDALINWAQPGYTASIVSGGSNFTPDIGWFGAILNTTLNPVATQSNFGTKGELWIAGNTASLYDYKGSAGIYITNANSGAISNPNYDMGAVGSPFIPGNNCTLRISVTTGNVTPAYSVWSDGRVMQTNYARSILQNGKGGLHCVRRLDYNRLEYHLNGITVDSSRLTTEIVDRGPILIGDANLNTTGTSVAVSGAPSIRQICFAYIGAETISPEIIYRRVNEYFTYVMPSNIVTY